MENRSLKFCVLCHCQCLSRATDEGEVIVNGKLDTILREVVLAYLRWSNCHWTNLTLYVPCIILQCVNVTLCVPCIILQCVNVTLCVPCIILQCVNVTCVPCIILQCVNDQRDAQFCYNQFLFHIFLSALHVSNESSRSSSGARHNILYYTVQCVNDQRDAQFL